MIESLFSTPFFLHQLSGDTLDKVQTEISQALPEIRKSNLQQPWGDDTYTTFTYGKNTTNDLVKFKLNLLIEEIKWASLKYAQDLGYGDPKFVLDESWFNFSNYGGYQYDHAHTPARVSGIYYYQTNGKDGGTRFRHPAPMSQHSGFPFDKLPIETGVSNPTVGKILLFPSWVVHRVDRNTTQNERITVAFNLY